MPSITFRFATSSDFLLVFVAHSVVGSYELSIFQSVSASIHAQEENWKSFHVCETFFTESHIIFQRSNHFAQISWRLARLTEKKTRRKCGKTTTSERWRKIETEERAYRDLDEFELVYRGHDGVAWFTLTCRTRRTKPSELSHFTSAIVVRPKTNKCPRRWKNFLSSFRYRKVRHTNTNNKVKQEKQFRLFLHSLAPRRLSTYDFPLLIHRSELTDNELPPYTMVDECWQQQKFCVWVECVPMLISCFIRCVIKTSGNGILR